MPPIPRRPAGRRVESRRTEPIDIRTTDGWSLRADVHDPEGAPVGVAVLAHAMMARRTEFERPRGAGVVPMLVARGWRVIAFDFRGHGDSGPRASEGGIYGYDDLVARDMAAVCEFARYRAGGNGAVVLVGHSLGGHVGVAAQGAGLAAFDGIACVGATVWLRELEPSAARWMVKRATLAAILAVCRRLGRFPARRLRRGSDDETRAVFEDFARFARTGAWTSADGGVDYRAALGRVRVPVLQLVSDGDWLECPPACGARFIALCGGEREVIRVSAGDDGGPPPDHMGLVTSGRVAGAWDRVEAWMRRRVVAAR